MPTTQRRSLVIIALFGFCTPAGAQEACPELARLHAEGLATFTLEGKMGKDAVDFIFKGEGEEAEKVKGSVDELNADI